MGSSESRAEANAAAARRMHEYFNSREFELGAAELAPDAVWTDVAAGIQRHGRQGYIEFATRWATAFPDGRTEVRRVTADGETAVVEFIGRGTHGGPLPTPAGEIPATGRSVEVRFVEVMRFRNGLVIEGNTYYDSATFLRQLGLMPEPAAAH